MIEQKRRSANVWRHPMSACLSFVPFTLWGVMLLQSIAICHVASSTLEATQDYRGSSFTRIAAMASHLLRGACILSHTRSIQRER
eukprot:4922982-Amphidinium_carterae.1